MGELGIRESARKIAKDGKPQYLEHEIEGIGKVFIKRLNSGEKDRLERACKESVGRAPMVVHCCFDEQGARIFEDEDMGFIEELDPDLIDPVVKKALAFNRYTEPEYKELEKNLNGQAVSS